jgi:hypothetical protein
MNSIHPSLAAPRPSTSGPQKASTYPDFTIIVGSGRSGTTYLLRTLLLGLSFGGGSEPKFVVKTYNQMGKFGDLNRADNLRRFVEYVHDMPMFRHLHKVKGIPSTSDELLARVQEPTYTGVMYAAFQLIAEKRGKHRLGYKQPLDLYHMPLLAAIFPTARFIHIVRDGRDVALSLLKFDWGENNLYAGARYWERAVNAGHRDGLTLGDRYFELRMEDLISDTERVAHEVGMFVTRGQDADEVAQYVAHVQESKRIDSINQWQTRLSPEQRFLCEAASGDTLRRFNYPTEYPEGIRIPRYKAAYYLGSSVALRAKNHLWKRFAPSARQARRPGGR